ncbi:hypothetical protein J3F83DRAFT_55514 [Trichoderma novae-zelandiae]
MHEAARCWLASRRKSCDYSTCTMTTANAYPYDLYASWALPLQPACCPSTASSRFVHRASTVLHRGVIRSHWALDNRNNAPIPQINRCNDPDGRLTGPCWIGQGPEECVWLSLFVAQSRDRCEDGSSLKARCTRPCSSVTIPSWNDMPNQFSVNRIFVIESYCRVCMGNGMQDSPILRFVHLHKSRRPSIYMLRTCILDTQAVPVIVCRQHG